MKYKVGDEVIMKGKVVEVDRNDDDFPYKMAAMSNDFWTNEEDLSPAPEFEWGEEVYVSDEGVVDALTRKKKELFVGLNPTSEGGKYCCSCKNWNFIVKIPKEETKPVTLELTDSQLEQIKKQFNLK